jgi:predicted cupin superfamily sugar epimerase
MTRTQQTAQDWVRHLGLAAHPEGGYYREVYRSPLPAAAPWTAEPRSVATAIYFLLEAGQFSAFHRIRSDEIWHFYAGDTLVIEGIHPDGRRQSWRLGTDIASGALPQCIVPAGVWFGATLAGEGAYALVGCTVSPGFDFADFELADCGDLLARFPEHEEVILRLTPPARS